MSSKLGKSHVVNKAAEAVFRSQQAIDAWIGIQSKRVEALIHLCVLRESNDDEQRVKVEKALERLQVETAEGVSQNTLWHRCLELHALDSIERDIINLLLVQAAEPRFEE